MQEDIKKYLQELPEDRQKVMQQLRETILQNIPKGFEETFIYKSIGYVVPKTLYPNGYHCDNKLPLPFINIASQKNFIAIYHMGIYADPKLYGWFLEEYPKHCKSKLDMGKSCIRFKKVNEIPFQLIAELVSKMTWEDWVKLYEQSFRNK
ncbi:MAG: DUF1801 domain-containing protein [Sphingobacteriales bacterium]|jgi:hypothetical protein|nr:MAG: DUF1801 domain-containing protein [Sphingobacteriales bacterium]